MPTALLVKALEAQAKELQEVAKVIPDPVASGRILLTANSLVRMAKSLKIQTQVKHI